MDNNTSIKRTVSHRSTIVPKVHPHATRLTIGRSRELRIVQTRSILRHKNNCIVTDTSSVVVVSLEVTSLLIESKSMENIVVLVGSVEELSGGCVAVLSRVCLSEGVLVLEGVRLGVGAVVVQVCASTGGVSLGDTVVAAGSGVVAGAVTVPSEWREGKVLGVLDYRARSRSGIVNTPGADTRLAFFHDTSKSNLLNLVRSLSVVINNSNNLISLGSIDIRQQPVIKDISLNSPSKLQLSVIDEISELSLRLADGTRGAGELVMLVALLDSLGVVGLDRKREDRNGVLESFDGILFVTLGERTGHLAFVEAVSVGEDFSISTNLSHISKHFDSISMVSLTLTLKSALSTSTPLTVCLKLTCAMPLLPT